MISEKDYNEIYLQGYEDGKNDKNNLEIHYEIKPSFTTRKIKELQQKNQKLKERIEYLERSNNRREDTILEQRQKIGDLEDNWNKLKEIAKSRSGLKTQCYNGGLWFEIDELLDKMQELEQGED